ncbi:MAG: hypothetical protein PHV59_09060 [Victivallales bacterium]|nr:hypothetical protein [Victivallales bacterium]
MDYTFLADGIKARLEELQPERQPMCVIRGSGGFNNEPGESYLIPYPEVIYLFGRNFSDPDFAFSTLGVSGLSDIRLRPEAFCAELELVCGNDMYKLKISSAEIPNAELMLEKFSSVPQAPPEPEAAVDSEEVSPFLGLAVILMFIAAANDEIADAEQEHILRFCQNDETLYNRAYELYCNKSYEEFLSTLMLDEQQKLCYLANIMEMAMVDGLYDSEEQTLIRIFTDAAELPADKIRAIEKVLLIKNQLSVL